MSYAVVASTLRMQQIDPRMPNGLLLIVMTVICFGVPAIRLYLVWRLAKAMIALSEAIEEWLKIVEEGNKMREANERSAEDKLIQ